MVSCPFEPKPRGSNSKTKPLTSHTAPTASQAEADATLESATESNATKHGDLPMTPNMVHCQRGSGARAYCMHAGLLVLITRARRGQATVTSLRCVGKGESRADKQSANDAGLSCNVCVW